MNYTTLVPPEPIVPVPSDFHLYELRHVYGGNGLYLIKDLGENFLLVWQSSTKLPAVVWRRLMSVLTLPKIDPATGQTVKLPVPVPVEMGKFIAQVREDLASGKKVIERGFLVDAKPAKPAAKVGAA